MLLKLFWILQWHWILLVIFIKTLKIIIQIKKKETNIFFDMIADMLSNKKLNPIVTELFVRGRKWNISLVFITQCYFAVPKDVRLNCTHYFITKIPNKQEVKQIASQNSSNKKLTFKTLLIFTKNVLKNDIIF